MVNTSPDSSLVLTVPETAKALKLSPNSIRKAIHEGRIHAIRLGRKFLIPRAELEKMLGQTTEGD